MHIDSFNTLFGNLNSFARCAPLLDVSLQFILTAIVAQEDLIEGKTARAWMRALPEQEKMAIQQQIAVFREEKKKLDMEIAKWDSRGNDIIMLAKQMCMIMMEMTDFTR